MKPHNRKLLLLYDDTPHTSFTNSPLPNLQPITTIHNATSPSSSSSPPLAKTHFKTLHPQSSPTFDSSIALTLLVLLTALFFMGFFSIYIRRFADSSTGEISRRRRHHHHPHRHRDTHDTSISLSYPPSMLSSRKGLDPAAVRSLPVYSYRGDAMYQGECLICLGEFEEKDTVKIIPFCKHVFHLQCIDTWFASHVTCPVCRGTQLFEVQKSGDLGVSEINGRSTMENDDTCIEVREVGTFGLRRTSSCSNIGDLGERVLLQRTASF